MGRKKTPKNIYDTKPNVYEFDGVWSEVLGKPEKNGIWLIYGKEKNGKTTFALQLANYLSDKGIKVWYYSAEEGTKENFKMACARAKVPYDKSLIGFDDYEPLEGIREDLNKRNAARIVFIDNLTIYADEINKSHIKQLILDYKDTLFVFMAHEEKKKPDPAIARHCKKVAKIYFHVQGLACHIDGRCPGGTIIIDEEKAAIHHGQD